MMPNPKTEKSDANRPPPLPPAKAASKGGAFDGLKASVTIRRMRAGDRARRFWGWVKRRPVVAGAVFGAIVIAAGAAVAVATDSLPDLLPDIDLFAPATAAGARANARAHPDNAVAQRDYGHALWAARKRHSAVARYSRALAIDRTAADDRMVANLVASFGTRDQHKAEALIEKNQLVGADKGLEALVTSRRRPVRWGAVHTLDRIGKGTRANWEKAYVLDLLDSPQCEVRRTAVEKLGAIGTRRALPALKSARAEDEKTGGWFRSRCLGGRLDEAEQKIAARR